MFRRAEPNRCSPFARRWLALGAVGALLLGSLGCGGDQEAKTGGANTRQAKENRKIAENTSVEAVQTAAREQVAHHAELKKQSHVAQFVSALLPTVRVSSSPTPPASPSPPAPPAPPAVQKPQPIPQQQFVAVNTRPESPVRTARRQSSPVVISERVVTDIPYPTEAEADARTLEDAQKLIEKRLRELDPPVEYLPPISVVKNEYVRRDSRHVRLPTESEKNAIALAGYPSDRRYVEYTVEISDEQVRELRTRNRVADGLRGLGVMAAVSLAGFFFLRLDEWSKGYLTSWLALGAAALGGGIVALVVTA